ncbi:PREDICTED: maestro heat-like repeat-containing protein family member 2A [Miniopterus natalensis]|uniref:maestro heat-like repeat-containing protein family member 2A n=1 Tax=Miniopterus natalensis TaxID=291302 RepID=UPI0007A6D72B|nr:PREDICTED: maestro heat-like repeat-containing protein family member 2A [Miniopterus natalensis]
MVIKNCWHNCPVFSLIIRILQDLGYRNHLTAFVFMTELLRCPEVAAMVDDTTAHVLAGWFQCEEVTVVKLLLRIVEILVLHGDLVNGVRQLHLLQPYVLNCCYCVDGEIVAETLRVLKCLAQHLTWQKSSSFLVQITFTLRAFFEVESEHLRLMAFEIYGTILAKVKRRRLVFPLKHQVLNLLILLVLHLEDRNAGVVEACRPTLRRMATILGWWRLKAIFAQKDVWTILRALLEQEAGKALWFLRQSVALFKSPQAPIRQAAVWFVGQIIQTLDMDEGNEIQEAYTALRSMTADPEAEVSCLTKQTLYVLEARKNLPVESPTSCFCSWRL